MLVFTINVATNEMIILVNTLSLIREWVTSKLSLQTYEGRFIPYVAEGKVSSNITIVCPNNFAGVIKINSEFTERFVAYCKQINSPHIKYIENYERIILE